MLFAVFHINCTNRTNVLILLCNSSKCNIVGPFSGIGLFLIVPIRRCVNRKDTVITYRRTLIADGNALPVKFHFRRAGHISHIVDCTDINGASELAVERAGVMEKAILPLTLHITPAIFAFIVIRGVLHRRDTASLQFVATRNPVDIFCIKCKFNLLIKQ